MRADVVVVGAGPAGLAAAISARQRGMDVIVVDPHTPPIDKACGEGIMPTGVRLLRDLGVDLQAGRPFLGIALVDHDVIAQAPFLRGPGLAMRRTALSTSLYERAQAVGARFSFGGRVQRVTENASMSQVMLSTGERIDARHVIAADGLHSVLRKRLGVMDERPRTRRFGVRRHFRVAPWSSFVEVYFGDGTEAYVTPLGDDEVGVAILSARVPLSFDAALERFETLRTRLAGAQATSDARGAGPFFQDVTRRQQGRTLLIGDAAGYVDAITGEGLSLAFESARLAVDAIATHRTSYEHAAKRARRSYEVFTRLMLSLSRHAKLRRAAISTLARHPAALSRLLAMSMGDTA